MDIALGDFISLNRIHFTSAHTKEELIDELIRVSVEDAKVKNVKSFKEALIKREEIMSTGIGYGVAIPHVKLQQIEDFFITIGIHKNGVDWESLDSNPVHLVFLIAGPAQKQEQYLRILARLTMAIKNPERREKATGLSTKYEIYKLFSAF